MSTGKILPLITALMVTTIATTAQANVISFGPQAQIAGLGSEVTFDVNMEFIGTTVGGSFDLFYDADILSFVSFEFDASFLAGIADPDFSVLPDNCLTDGAAISGCSVGDEELNGIAFGNFDGITGIHTIGTLTFTAINTGVAVLTMATNDSPWEGFYSIDASLMPVHYGPAKVQVVPVPAAAWLFISGIGLLGGIARRR